MAPNTQVKSKAGKESINKDNKTISTIIPNRQLTHILSSPPMPMADILMIQPETSPTPSTSSIPSASSIPSTNAANSPHQTPKNNKPIKKAQNSLNNVLRHFNESYQAACNKISQDEDRIMIIVEISFNVFEEIEGKVNETLYFITQ